MVRLSISLQTEPPVNEDLCEQAFTLFNILRSFLWILWKFHKISLTVLAATQHDDDVATLGRCKVDIHRTGQVLIFYENIHSDFQV